MQQFGPGRIAEEPAKAEAAHQLDRGNVMVQHHGLEAAGLHQPVDDLPEPPDARDDHRALFGDLVLGRGISCIRQAARQQVVKDEQQRRDQHRQGHDQ